MSKIIRHYCSYFDHRYLARGLAMIESLRTYAPYSKFKVGAVVLTQSGKTFTGCNVENSSYGLTCCAERNAIFNAVGAGAQDLFCLLYP